MCECNRAPFDFREGERELISGFNIEYRRGGFVLLFLREYGIMILFALLTDMFFFSFRGVGVVMILLFILLRSVFPRYRYDKLIKLM